MLKGCLPWCTTWFLGVAFANAHKENPACHHPPFFPGFRRPLCGRAAVELADRRAGGVATYLGILLALSLLTGRARAWASQSHSGWPVRWWMCWKAPAAS